MILPKVWTKYSMTIWNIGKACMAHARRNVSFSLRFAGIIQRAYEQTGQRVVILVDEYDKPMLQAIGNEETAKILPKHTKAFLWSIKE